MFRNFIKITDMTQFHQNHEVMHLAIKGCGVDVGIIKYNLKCTQTVKFEILYYNNF